jgi:hypothetical protein
VLQRLYELDDHYGGSGGVYALTVRTVQRMRRLMNQASFDQATGQALLSITGEVTEHAGWLAFDAGRHAEARYWWLEALQAAHRANSNDVTTVALASMSLQAATQGRASRTGNAVYAKLLADHTNGISLADQPFLAAQEHPDLPAVAAAQRLRDSGAGK